MAYGTIKDTHYNPGQTKFTANHSGSIFAFQYGSSVIRDQYEYRTGTNSASKPLKKAPKVVTGTRLETRYRKIYFGKRTKMKVWSKKLGKWMYSRESYFLRPYLAKIPIKTRAIPSLKGFDLPPNNLEYGKLTTEIVAPSSIHSGYYSGTHYYLEGWTAHEMGAAYGMRYGPHPQNEGYYTPSTQAASLADSLSAKCYSKFLDKIKNSKVSIAQALGERKQTVALILDLGSKVAIAIKNLKRGNLTAAISSLVPKNSKQLANDWLQFQYGIRPLLSDIEGAVEILKTDQKFVFDVVATRKGTFGPVPKHDMQGSYGSSYNSHCNVSWDTSVSGDVTVKYKARIRITSPGMQFLTSVGLTNLPALLWELTPWSFVADWFIPIGDYLHKMDALNGTEVMYAHKSVLTHETVTQTKLFYGYKDIGYPTRVTGTTVVDYVKTHFKRTVLTSLPSAPIPRLSDSPLNLGRALNALALLRQLRK